MVRLYISSAWILCIISQVLINRCQFPAARAEKQPFWGYYRSIQQALIATATPVDVLVLTSATHCAFLLRHGASNTLGQRTVYQEKEERRTAKEPKFGYGNRPTRSKNIKSFKRTRRCQSFCIVPQIEIFRDGGIQTRSVPEVVAVPHWHFPGSLCISSNQGPPTIGGFRIRTFANTIIV